MLPQGWDRRTTVFLAFVLLVLSGTHGVGAQVFDLERDRVQIVKLNGLVRFHSGDDPDGKLGWADPNFDDSGWKLMPSDQLLPGNGGMGWYRFRVVLPANHPPLALYIAHFAGYEVFAGGRSIGQFGGLPPHEKVYFNQPGESLGQFEFLGQVMPIPADVAEGTPVFAIRIWQWPDWSAGLAPMFPEVSIGDARLLIDERQHRWDHGFWYLSAKNTLVLGYLLAALAGLGLFLLRPREIEYLWFAGVELVFGAHCVWAVYPAFHPVWYQGFEATNGLLMLLQGCCLSMFFVSLLKERRGRVFWSTIGSALFGTLMFVPIVAGWMNFTSWLPAIYLAWLPFIGSQLLMLYLPARRGNLDARLLLVPFGLQYGAVLGRGLIFVAASHGHSGSVIDFWAKKWEELFHWPFPISAQSFADFLCQISLLAILVLRFGRTRRDEERFKGELEAARTVQQLLVPAEKPAIAGFDIDAVYKPAGQVGGDFFQVLPVCDGCALIVIGDVSGKGMPAAMTVSLLVGTVRTLAHYTQSPGEILSAMNQRMLARSKDGFTTCLVLRIDVDGAVTAANAGHLPPYLGAQELAVNNGLPLGLAADAVYAESSFHLGVGQELTLLTDGIAEARCKAGELFGFERTASISILSAEHIAATAAAFGQQDDITVLKIQRCPVCEPVGVPLLGDPATTSA